jgi:trk system potassium uptake protein TrkH
MMVLKDFKVILRDLGMLLMIVALSMTIPMAVGAAYGDSWATMDDFLIAALLTGIIGTACYFLIRDPGEMSLKHAIALMVLFWPITCVFSALPFSLSGVSPTYLDSFFEAMSGWTTTGLTTIGVSADTFPHSINMWRGMLQFMGGIGVILISIAVLSQARTGGESISKMASEFSPEERLRPGIWGTAKTLLVLMLAFLFICSIILLISGMDPFDAVFHAMSGLATGGFSTHPESIAYFNSNAIELATMIVMIVGSMNFMVHITVFSGNYKELLKNIEVRSFLILAILFSFAGAIWLWSNPMQSPPILQMSDAANYSIYHVISAMTTTGWSIVPGGNLVAAFPAVFILALAFCMIIGGSSISTAGGIRQIRVALIAMSIWWHIKKVLLPSTVVFPRSYHHIVKKTVTDSRMTDIYVFVSIYIMMLAISTIVIASYGNDIQLSFCESATALTSTGLDFNIATLSAAGGVKLMLIIDMWLGRIEIIPILLFIASFSRRFR